LSWTVADQTRSNPKDCPEQSSDLEEIHHFIGQRAQMKSATSFITN